jgi:hypothetical protein
MELLRGLSIPQTNGARGRWMRQWHESPPAWRQEGAGSITGGVQQIASLPMQLGFMKPLVSSFDESCSLGEAVPCFGKLPKHGVSLRERHVERARSADGNECKSAISATSSTDGATGASNACSLTSLAADPSARAKPAARSICVITG